MPLVSCFRQGGFIFFLALTCTVRADERRVLVNKTATLSTASQCEARTINYITHSLPQSCLTSSWTNPVPLPTESAITGRHPIAGNDSTWSSAEEPAPPTVTPQSDTFSEANASDPVATPFMSFEDWKEMMLRRAGQDPQELRHRKSSEPPANDRSSPEVGDSGLGEEGEISLSFDNDSDGDDSGAGTYVDPLSRDAGSDNLDEILMFKDGKATVHRSKDAGKTCKERFSYSSFDAGATILKAGPEAKNAKAILVENKDSYMLLECAAQNKYVIVELSDDILIDTVVIANFEFFSSMIRHFRVSVSDRYPVKSDKWRDLGIFEARNSRDIQPFLVQNPQIWAKYVRIEFLTHYGNEYYCPVSLLRVHGSRMLDSWKESETGRDEEGLGEEDDGPASPHVNQLTAAADQPKLKEVGENSSEPVNTSPLRIDPFGQDPFYQLTATCVASFASFSETWLSDLEPDVLEEGDIRHQGSLQSEKRGSNTAFVSPRPDAAQIREAPVIPPSKQLPDPAMPAPDSRQAASAESIDNAGTGPGGPVANTSLLTNKAATSTASGGKGRNTWTTSATAASPTVQEGFFNAITKRLQQVESNLTLSLKYVEDQSRHMQDMLQRAEQKQLSKLSRFLGDLNQTVLTELRKVHDQYDQIWQSTVLALESQRDQSERDIVALSTRLNLLADEVVFQKRMAIVQAVLLLSCLFLVIFSRGVPIPYLSPLQEQGDAISYGVATPPPRQQLHRLHKSNPTIQQEEGSPTMPQVVDYSPRSTPPGSHDADHEATSVGYQHLSPPATPGLQDDGMYSDMHISGRDSQVGSLRRPTSLHHNNTRKPLPSLPEHPVPTHET